MNKELRKVWNSEARDVLLGKKIVRVCYLSQESMDDLMWHRCPIAIELEDGTVIIPQMDDEGNDGGALMYIEKGEQGVLPTL